MQNYLRVVGIVTGCLIIFVTLTQLEVAEMYIWVLFLSGPALVLWMVYSVLTAQVHVKETFEEQWYLDRPDLRRDLA